MSVTLRRLKEYSVRTGASVRVSARGGSLSIIGGFVATRSGAAGWVGEGGRLPEFADDEIVVSSADRFAVFDPGDSSPRREFNVEDMDAELTRSEAEAEVSTAPA